MIPRLLIVIGSLFFTTLLVGQINESDTLKFKANLALTGIYQGGNVETVIFRAKSDISFIPFRKSVFKTTNSYIYQAFGGTKADEDILSLNFLYFNPTRKIYPLLLGFVSTNFRRSIDLRYLVGGGVNFQLLQKKKQWLKLALSSEYENTTFGQNQFNLSEYNGNTTINTMRFTVWLNGKYHIFNDKIIVSHESYYQPSLSQSNNYRWQVDLGLSLPIWKFLNFKINYVHTFESVVITNQKQGDQILTFGFTVKTY